MPRKVLVWSAVTVVPTTEVTWENTTPLKDPEAPSNLPVPPVIVASTGVSDVSGLVLTPDPVNVQNTWSPFAATHSPVPATVNVPGAPGVNVSSYRDG